MLKAHKGKVKAHQDGAKLSLLKILLKKINKSTKNKAMKYTIKLKILCVSKRL